MLKRGEGVHRSMYVLIRRRTGNPYTLSILLQTEDDCKKKKKQRSLEKCRHSILLASSSFCVFQGHLEILCPHVLSKQMARGLCRASSHVVLHAFFLSSLFVAWNLRPAQDMATHRWQLLGAKARGPREFLPPTSPPVRSGSTVPT